MTSHLSKTAPFKGRLSRNSTHRKKARDYLKGRGIYDVERTIKAGLKRAGSDAKRGWRKPEHYKLEYKKPRKKKNFKGGTYPYLNQSHHMLPCEVFYSDEWEHDHLLLVRNSGYNINDEENIIYLPQCGGQLHLCFFHDLPDHSKNHLAYNRNMVKRSKPVMRLIKKTVAADCEEREDIRKKIYDKLKKLESDAYGKLTGAGAKPIGSVL